MQNATLMRWQEEGVCVEVGPDPFFVDYDKDIDVQDQLHTVRKICGGCPVKEQCLSYAVANNITDGVWGGYTTRERRILRRKRQQEQRSTTTRYCRYCGWNPVANGNSCVYCLQRRPQHTPPAFRGTSQEGRFRWPRFTFDWFYSDPVRYLRESE
jgi:WhiB family transcriptional regulator, redox-sensing transcriptional regulator